MPRQAQNKRATEPKSKNNRERSKSQEDAQDVRDARRALKEARKKGSIPWDQVKREVGI